MKFELYMTSPEQEFSHRTIQAAAGFEASVSPEQMPWGQWLRRWDPSRFRVWGGDWYRFQWDPPHGILDWLRTATPPGGWCRGWPHDWINFVPPPWKLGRNLKGEEPVEIEPIIRRLLLRREEFGFLAMDGLTGRVLKLDKEAGKLIQLVQDGLSPEEAAEQLGAKKEELEEFIAFLELYDISAQR